MTNTQIATTIFKQLGGNKFAAMTGSKNFLSDGNALLMHLTRNKAKAKYLRIELNAMDTYTMTFRGPANKNTLECAVIEKIEGVYNDMLADVFTRVTGLDTKF